MTSTTFLLAIFASFVNVSLGQSCIAAWGQCGGIGWSGATCCASGYTCSTLNPYYSQCIPGTASSSSPGGIASTSSSSGKSSSLPSTTHVSTSTTSTASSPYSGADTYTTTDTASVPAHTQLPYPSTNASDCGAWPMEDGVCCAQYCSTNNASESCSSSCSGACVQPPAADCKSGTMWGEQHTVGNDEPWHYSRSTHFGLTSGGACGFGLYGLCTKGSKTASWTDPMLGTTCDAFCTAYPNLCKDPSDLTLRGNFAAPNGDYYTQFWSSLVGDRDNYLSCGECFELIHTKPDGTDYAVGEAGYTDPITLEIVDSCPCSANSKWCCGPGDDHCGEVSNFKYGCPLPAGSHHMDLSDIAMGRLQGNGSLTDGVIPIRYKRVPCPKPGNIYIWLRDGGGPYYFALTAVNTGGVGSVTKIEISSSGQSWTPLVRDPNYTTSRPQERYGAWVVPQGAGPFNPPISLRLTSPNGQQVVNTDAIKSFTAPSSAPAGFYYIDLGVQFT